MIAETTLSLRARVLPWMVVAVTVVAIVSWLLNTPEGWLGKADAVGYAICHRMDGRSLHLGDRPLPLCARCTGIYLGVLLGTVVLGLIAPRNGRLSPWPIMAVLGLFVALMGVDGVNSYLTLFPRAPHLYEPQNWLRVITGTFNGLAIAGMIYPVFVQTLWRDWQDRPALGRWRDLGLLALFALLVIGLVLSEVDEILYPLALLSTVGVVTVLVMINTTILLLVTRQENRFESWRTAWLPILAGFTLAIIQIGFVDAVRFAIFRSWSGFVFPGQ
jgi:uncharacterized membrane protein